MKLKITALLVLTMLTGMASISVAQTYKTDFSTQIVLAGGGIDPIHTVTLATAPTPGTSAITLKFPTSLPGTAGYVLSTDQNGNLSWVNPATGFSLAGDVTGSAGANTVAKINGVPLGATTATAGNLLIGSGTEWVSQTLGGDATLAANGTLALANTPGARSDLGLGSIATQDASAVNITGGTVGGSTTINTSGTITGGATTANGAVNLDAGLNTGGTNNIGNSTSTTNLNGAVNLTGTVSFTNAPTLPAGSVTNTALAHSTIGLTSTGSSLTVTGSPIALGGSGNLDLNMANTNTWTAAQNFNGGIASTGSNDLALASPSNQAVDLNTTNANQVNIATGSNANTIDIGNGNGSTGTYSTTNFAGKVNFTGAVSLPNGSVSPSSLPLGTNHILIGVGGNAQDDAVTQDVTLADNGSNQAVATVNGSHAATFTATGNGSFAGTLGAGAITGTSLSAGSGSISTTGTVSGGTGTFTTLSGTTMGGDLAMGGNNITGGGSFSGTAITGTGNAQIGSGANGNNSFGTGTNATNTIGVGGATPSTTTINGNLDITGAVTLPNGAVTASSLALNDGQILIGNISNHAAPQTLSQDVTISDAGVATANGSHATTFAVANNQSVGGTLTVTGQTSLGSTVLTNGGTISFATDQNDISPAGTSSYFFLTNTDGTNSHSVGGITGGVIGRMIVLVNTGTAPIVLLNQSGGSTGTQLAIAGGNAIMSANGSATFIYDGTNWHMTASQ